MEPGRRRFLAGLLGATSASLAGCSSLPFLGSSEPSWTEWIHEPRATRYLTRIGANQVQFVFEYSEPATILERRSSLTLTEDSRRALQQYSTTHSALGVEASTIDRWVETNSTVRGGRDIRAVILVAFEGRFDRETVRSNLRGTEAGGYRDWDLFATADGSRAVGVGDERVVVALSPTDDEASLKRPLTDAVERGIDVLDGSRDPSITGDRLATALVTSFDEPLHATGSTTLPITQFLDGLQAVGGESHDPTNRRYRWVGIFEDPTVVSEAELRDLLANVFETLDSVTRSGRMVTATGRVTAEIWLN
jgi:hypothetical protein